MTNHMRLSMLRLERPTRGEFLCKCVRARQPAILTGLTSDLSWERETPGGAATPSPLTWLEGERDHLIRTHVSDDAQWRNDIDDDRPMLPLGEFLSQVKRKNPKHFAAQASLLTHPWILERFPLAVLEKLVDLADVGEANLWIQGSGNRTHLHHDYSDNLNFLLEGKKRFVLYAPDQLDNMYSVRAFGGVDKKYVNWSMVDVFDVDAEKFPRFVQTEPLTIDVQGGDTLYLPACWWHAVDTTAPSCGINFWFGLTRADRDGIPFADWYKPTVLE